MVALFALVTAFLLGLVELLRRSRKALLASQAVLENARKESLETSQALQQALRAARMGHWTWDIPTGKVTWSDNLEEIHGVPRGAFKGKF